MSAEERPEVATNNSVAELNRAREIASARYGRARPLLRQALELASSYLEDGAPISGYTTLLRACERVVQLEAEAGPGPWAVWTEADVLAAAAREVGSDAR